MNVSRRCRSCHRPSRNPEGLVSSGLMNRAVAGTRASMPGSSAGRTHGRAPDSAHTGSGPPHRTTRQRRRAPDTRRMLAVRLVRREGSTKTARPMRRFAASASPSSDTPASGTAVRRSASGGHERDSDRRSLRRASDRPRSSRPTDPVRGAPHLRSRRPGGVFVGFLDRSPHSIPAAGARPARAVARAASGIPRFPDRSLREQPPSPASRAVVRRRRGNPRCRRSSRSPRLAGVGARRAEFLRLPGRRAADTRDRVHAPSPWIAALHLDGAHCQRPRDCCQVGRRHDL